jgi:hypothetical protein
VIGNDEPGQRNSRCFGESVSTATCNATPPTFSAASSINTFFAHTPGWYSSIWCPVARIGRRASPVTDARNSSRSRLRSRFWIGVRASASALALECVSSNSRPAAGQRRRWPSAAGAFQSA